MTYLDPYKGPPEPVEGEADLTAFNDALRRGDWPAVQAALDTMDPTVASDLQEMVLHARGYVAWARGVMAGKKEGT